MPTFDKLKERLPKGLRIFLRTRHIWLNNNITLNIRCYIGMCRRKKLMEAQCYNKKKRIVFLCSEPTSWNSLKTIYMAAKADNRAEIFLLAVPNYTKTNEMYQFLKENDCNVIDAYANDEWFNLEKFKPDIIIQQTPYNAQLPVSYRNSSTSKYAKVCYIPYNYNFSKAMHLDIEYNKDFLSHVYAIYADNKTVESYLCEKISSHKLFKGIHIFYMGFPRFDLIKERKLEEHKNLKYTWIPRWSLDTVNNCGTSFFTYFDLLVDYFNQNLDDELIIRPHPLMFSNFIKVGAMTQQDVVHVKERIEVLPNVSFDTEKDYWVSFDKTDILIADFSSLVVEFGLTGRPILYCGERDDFNFETQEILDSMYIVQDKDDLVNQLKCSKDYIIFNKKRAELQKNFTALNIKKSGEMIWNSIMEL